MTIQSTNIPESDIEDRLRSDAGRLSGSGAHDTFLSEISGGAFLVGDFVREDEPHEWEVCTRARAQGVIVGFVNEARTRARVRLLSISSREIGIRVGRVLRDLLTIGSIDQLEARRLRDVFQVALGEAERRARISELGQSQQERQLSGVANIRPLELERAYQSFMEQVSRIPELPPPDNRQPPSEPESPALKPLSPSVRLIEEKRSRRRIIRHKRK